MYEQIENVMGILPAEFVFAPFRFDAMLESVPLPARAEHGPRT